MLPTYDRAAVRPGIVHLGLGAFPRAHLAYYMDALLHTGQPSASSWGLAGVGVRAEDRAVGEALRAQDGLYTVVGRGGSAADQGEGEVEVRVVGSVVEYIFAPDEPQRLLDRLLSPHTRIVSLTVTEGGYDSDKNPEIDADSDRYPQYQRLLEAATGSSQSTDSSPVSWPRSAFGWIVLGLDGRRRLGLPAYSVLSMDNVQLNGEVTKRCLLHIARRVPELSAHIGDTCCPSAMVDRIVPVTTPELVAFVRTRYGVEDRWPVLPEQYMQWVVEDAQPFPSGRPPLELLAPASADSDRYNVLLVRDVANFEHMKLRLLNASHSGICYLACLAGYRFIYEAMADPLFVEHMRRFMDDEVTDTLPPVPSIDLQRYKRTLVERFANSNIRDTVRRVCQNGASKWPKFLVPTLRHRLEQWHEAGSGELHLHHSALIVAAWLRYLDGVDDDGHAIAIEDGTAERLGLLDLAAENRVGKLGGSASAKQLMEAAGETVFSNVAQSDAFVSEVQRALDQLYEVGARATMQRWMEIGKKRSAAARR